MTKIGCEAAKKKKKKKKKKHHHQQLCSPRTASVACRRGLWMMQVNIWSRSPQFGSNRTSTFQMRPFSHFQPILQLDLTWPLNFGIWPLTPWTYEGSHILSMNQVWFQSDFNFSNKAIFTFLAYLTTWPQMTFDLGI